MTHPPEIRYVVVDVFTKSRFGGNQLAVIPDARGLSDGQMQRIANEFNFSETTFVLPASDPGNTARVRIFNRMHEMPFAGHPNVGTAYVLGRQGCTSGEVRRSMQFEENAGLVAVDLLMEGGTVCGAAITAPKPLEIGNPVDPDVVASCLGLPAKTLVLDHHPPVEISVGLPFIVVETTGESLSVARPDHGAFRAAATSHSRSGRFATFVYARAATGIDRLRARMFSPLTGTVEDPATGSAAAALGAYLAALDSRPVGDVETRIEQGIEMGRPSEITVLVSKAQGRIARVRIAGQCVQTMQGILQI